MKCLSLPGKFLDMAIKQARRERGDGWKKMCYRHFTDFSWVNLFLWKAKNVREQKRKVWWSRRTLAYLPAALRRFLLTLLGIWVHVGQGLLRLSLLGASPVRRPIKMRMLFIFHFLRDLKSCTQTSRCFIFCAFVDARGLMFYYNMRFGIYVARGLLCCFKTVFMNTILLTVFLIRLSGWWMAFYEMRPHIMTPKVVTRKLHKKSLVA